MVWKTKEKEISITINGNEQAIKMKCGPDGRGYFEEEVCFLNKKKKKNT